MLHELAGWSWDCTGPAIAHHGYVPRVCLCLCVFLPLQFRPPLEELRAGYYREMKKFISIPSLFTGFGNAEVFAPMAERNAASLTQVYRKVRTRGFD